MGIYEDQVLPRVIDKVCGIGSVTRWRRRAVEGLSGTVIEPGFGSGLNLPVYPSGVSRVYAVDPAQLGQKLAAKRLAASPFDVQFIGLDGQTIPLDDNSCDAGLSTFTLCTIPDSAAALGELRRVIKPGGSLHFLEHGQAPDAKVQRWQGRMEPMQKKLAGGCHLTRDIPSLIEAAGFDIEWVDTGYAKGLKPMSWYFVGRATNP
jgi:ubiquinone/menaquinone biosynthesis C-methylase UbiE